MISWEDFENVELRIGTIIEVNEFPEARRPAYKLKENPVRRLPTCTILRRYWVNRCSP